MAEGTPVTASIAGVTLASLLTGLPRVGPTSAYSNANSERGSALNDVHHFDPQGSVPSVQGSSEGLLLGSFLDLRMQREHRDMGAPTHAESAERAEGEGSSALWPTLSSTSADWGDGESTQPEVVIERFWESLPGGFQVSRLMDAAGAVSSEAVADSVMAATSDVPVSDRSKGSKAKDKTKEKHGGEGAALHAEELRSVVGWYVRRRGRPMRPSMREAAGTVALQRLLGTRANTSAQHSGEPGPSGPERPMLFLILSSSEDARGCIHTSNFRLFAADPSWQHHPGAGSLSHAHSCASSSPALVPIPLKVANLGNIPRPQYSIVPAGLESFRGLSALETHGRDGKVQGKVKGKALRLDFGSGGMMSLMAQQSRQQVAGLEDVYGAVLERLTSLCDDLAKAKSTLDTQPGSSAQPAR